MTTLAGLALLALAGALWVATFLSGPSMLLIALEAMASMVCAIAGAVLLLLSGGFRLRR